jgi:hypothetical protein
MQPLSHHAARYIEISRPSTTLRMTTSEFDINAKRPGVVRIKENIYTRRHPKMPPLVFPHLKGLL